MPSGRDGRVPSTVPVAASRSSMGGLGLLPAPPTAIVLPSGDHAMASTFVGNVSCQMTTSALAGLEASPRNATAKVARRAQVEFFAQNGRTSHRCILSVTGRSCLDDRAYHGRCSSQLHKARHLAVWP